MANYNYAGYISQSIDSVLAQSYPNWELLICDDGSTDDSVRLIERYTARDSRIRLLRKANGGHTSALNAAFSISSGDILCFLDSDDLYLPEKLQKIVTASQSHSQAGLLIHRVIRIDEQRRRQGVWPLSALPDGWFGADLLRSGGILSYLPPTSGLSLRRPIAEQLFPLSMTAPLHMCPDQVLMRLTPFLTGIKSIPESLAEYRLHSANTYSQQSTTAESVGRELTLSKALWEEQHRFLSVMDPQIAGQLSALDDSPNVALLRYLEARLRKDSAASRKYHSEYMAVCQRQGESKWLRFWRLSIYLPYPLFRAAINLLLGQGPLKQLVARIKKLA